MNDTSTGFALDTIRPSKIAFHDHEEKDVQTHLTGI
jgi:hypothetical protein